MKRFLVVSALLASACIGTIGNEDGSEGSSNPDDADYDVGATPLRRLTRAEYDNTVFDLLGLDGSPADSFAPDELVGTFESNAVAPIGELQVEQYMAAAEELAAAADLAKLLPCDPAVTGEAQCAQEFVDRFGSRALRRPLSDELRAQLMNAYQVGAADGFDSGARLVIETALQSPFFLYHVELPPEGAGGLVRLDPYALASRLSFFLWRSMPDDALFEAAGSGALDSRDGLRAQAERMLADDRAARTITGFHMQWLGLRDFEQLEKDPAVFPDFDRAMREAMQQETERFTDWVLRKGDGSLAALLTGAYSFPTGSVAALYGVNESSTEPVDLDPSQRAGVLTHASFLAMHSHPNQTSPVHRGVVVRENILCQTLPPPPENVDNVAPEPDPSLTTRERFAVHTQDPSCAACHQLIDGIGFGFERYDAIGTYRATENDKPVDASGKVVDTDEGDIAFDGAVELGALLAGSSTVHACLVRQWFRYAFGRMEGDHDEEQLAALDQEFEATQQNVRALLLAVVESDAFSYRRVESTP